MEVNKSGLSHIDATVRGEGNFGQWHLTGFHGNPDTAKRAESWDLLKSLCGPNSLLWLIIGAFNEFVCASEKEGGVVRPIWQMARFKEAIDFCCLREVGFVGPQYMWMYQKHDGSQIRERLDRALATQAWLTLFPSAKLFHKSSFVSDRSPLLLSFLHKPKKKKQKKLFRFESMWLNDAGCDQVVSDVWLERLISGGDFPMMRNWRSGTLMCLGTQGEKQLSCRRSFNGQRDNHLPKSQTKISKRQGQSLIVGWIKKA